MRKLFMFSALGALVGAALALVRQRAMGTDVPEDTGGPGYGSTHIPPQGGPDLPTMVASGAAGGAIIALWASRRQRSKRKAATRRAAIRGKRSAEMARQAAATHARELVIDITEAAGPKVSHAAEVVRISAGDLADTARPRVSHAAEIARAKAVVAAERAAHAAELARPHVEHAAEIARHRALEAATVAAQAAEDAAHTTRTKVAEMA